MRPSHLRRCPTSCLNLAGAVAKRERQVGLSGFLRLDLFGDNNKTRGDDAVFVPRSVGDEELFHDLRRMNVRCPGGYDLPPWNRPSFLFFFSSLALASTPFVCTNFVW